MMVAVGQSYKIRGHPSLPSLAFPAVSRATFHGNHRHYVMILTPATVQDLRTEVSGPPKPARKWGRATEPGITLSKSDMIRRYHDQAQRHGEVWQMPVACRIRLSAA